MLITTKQPDATDRRILVTGGRGFIGRAVVHELQMCGYEVHTLGKSAAYADMPNLKHHTVDLLHLDDVTAFLQQYKFQNLIHLAWYMGPNTQFANENLPWVGATLHLAEQFRNNGGRKILACGSFFEYDSSFGYLREDTTPLFPGTLYGDTKACVFHALGSYCKNTGLIFTWTRLFSLYGPFERSTRFVPAVILSCLHNEPIRVSLCTKYQDYLHVADAAAAIVALWEDSIQGAVNVCSGTPIQLRTIVQKILDMMQSKQEVHWGTKPESFENAFVVGCPNRLTSTGWKQRYSLDDGLRATIAWWREQMK